MEATKTQLQELASGSDAGEGALRVLNFIQVEVENETPNQTILNVAIRFYFQHLHDNSLKDKYFPALIANEKTYHNERHLQAIYAVLQTAAVSNAFLDPEAIKGNCLRVICASEKHHNDHVLLALIRILNILCKKFPNINGPEMPLEIVYHCLQNGLIGLRDEILTLFTNSCRQSPAMAFHHFQFVLEFWPWTNRNKLYLLSAILSVHNLLPFLANAQQSVDRFFTGLRMCLRCKRLLPASQHLVKALSGQESKELLQLAANVLTQGTRQEIQNFHLQWFVRITQKDILFQLLQEKQEIACFLTDPTTTARDADENYRLILIFSLFARQIFTISKLHFFALSTDLITNCFQMEIEAQILIYKFVVDNVSSFAIEDCLEFVLSFIQHHRSVDSAQYRHDILGKIAILINYIAKIYSRLNENDTGTTLMDSITHFFRVLQHQIEEDMNNTIYQPKIFALRMFTIVLQSLYAPSLLKNAKNCITTQNKLLGNLLVDHNVFDAQQMSRKLFSLLSDPFGYDDAQDLIVVLLKLLGHETIAEDSVLLCEQYCQRNNIDDCALSVHYAKVALQAANTDNITRLFEFAWGALNKICAQYDEDPVLICKTGTHMFGYLQVLDEVVKIAKPDQIPLKWLTIIDGVECTLQMVLQKLNLANFRNEIDAVIADFQDMDTNLQLLITESACNMPEADYAECRKLLLMTFWLTLKSCCDTATAIGCQLVSAINNDPASENLATLQRCLGINMAVLTRCRHKGAIEAAGVSIGKLTKCITSQLPINSPAYGLLTNSLNALFDPSNRASTSRRGAGLAIMFLHVVKNEPVTRHRPLLQHALQLISRQLQEIDDEAESKTHQEIEHKSHHTRNYDSVEALTLHYLCVLVRDTELRDAIAPHYNCILVAAIKQIENPEWTICNAALQLVGAIIPKIVGQHYAAGSTTSDWEACEVTYTEIGRHLPQACKHILSYCTNNSERKTSTRSIILFLGFLSSVEHFRTATTACHVDPLLDHFRELIWQLLYHPSDKVRQLAAICCVRAHDFRTELQHLLMVIAQRLFQAADENHFHGFICTLIEGVAKMLYESKQTVDDEIVDDFMERLRDVLKANFKLNHTFKLYTFCKLFDLMLKLGFTNNCKEFSELIECGNRIVTTAGDAQRIGCDMWLRRAIVKD